MSSTNNQIATMMKQATENCVKCGRSRKATDGQEYYSSCENCSHLCCESVKPKETGSSNIVYESVWPHFLCGPCHNTLGSQGHGLQEPFSSGKGIGNPAFAANRGCETLPCHLKTKESCKADSLHKNQMLHSPHIHCAPCRLGKIQKAETYNCHGIDANLHNCVCQRMGDPRDSGWIDHREQ